MADLSWLPRVAPRPDLLSTLCPAPPPVPSPIRAARPLRPVQAWSDAERVEVALPPALLYSLVDDLARWSGTNAATAPETKAALSPAIEAAFGDLLGGRRRQLAARTDRAVDAVMDPIRGNSRAQQLAAVVGLVDELYSDGWWLPADAGFWPAFHALCERVNAVPENLSALAGVERSAAKAVPRMIAAARAVGLFTRRRFQPLAGGGE